MFLNHLINLNYSWYGDRYTDLEGQVASTLIDQCKLFWYGDHRYWFNFIFSTIPTPGDDL